MSVNSLVKSFHTHTLPLILSHTHSRWRLFCLLQRRCFHHSRLPQAGAGMWCQRASRHRAAHYSSLQKQLRAANVPHTDTVNSCRRLQSHLQTHGVKDSQRSGQIYCTILDVKCASRDVFFSIQFMADKWKLGLNQQGFLKSASQLLLYDVSVMSYSPSLILEHHVCIHY